MTTTQSERIQTIDILRGFALCGIFFVNSPSFFIPDPYYSLDYSGIDRGIRLFFDLFIQTKFYTIFAFLFGVSAFYFMRSIERKGLHPQFYFGKRLFWMFIFGMIHFNLLWFGDILHTYAFIGVYLLLFYKRKIKTKLIWAGSLYSFNLLYEFSNYLSNANYSMDTPYFSSILNAQGDINFYNNLSAQLVDRWHFFTFALPYEFLIFPFEFLPLFLLGMVLAEKGVLQKPLTFIHPIRKIQWLSLILSIPFLLLLLIDFMNQQEGTHFFIYVSGKFLAIFYVCTLLLMTANGKKLTFLAPLGKLAFTNYIMQTVVTLVVLPLFISDTSAVPLWLQVIYVSCFLVVQILFSNWIIKHYAYGPLEYIWRLLTYGRKRRNHLVEKNL